MGLIKDIIHNPVRAIAAVATGGASELALATFKTGAKMLTAPLTEEMEKMSLLAQMQAKAEQDKVAQAEAAAKKKTQSALRAALMPTPSLFDLLGSSQRNPSLG